MKKKYLLAYVVVILVTVILNTTNVFAYDNTVSNYYVIFTSGLYKDTIQFDYPNKNVFIYKENKTLYFYFYNEDLGKSELIDKTLINNGKFIIKNTYYGTTNEKIWNDNNVTTTSSSITINDTNMVMYTDLNEANTYYDSIYNSFPSTEEPSTEPNTEEPTEEPTEKPTEEPTEKPTEEPTEKPINENIDITDRLKEKIEKDFVYYVSHGFMFGFAITFVIALIFRACSFLLNIVKD